MRCVEILLAPVVEAMVEEVMEQVVEVVLMVVVVVMLLEVPSTRTNVSQVKHE